MSEVHVISLGAGVQSSVMALMAASGELGPMPVAAVFADTRAEPKSVYAWLDWLEVRLPFPVVRASAGSLTERSTLLRTSKKTGKTYLSPSLPVYTVIDGKRGMLPRQCTRDFKIDVVRRATKQVAREAGASSIVQWIGISTDEASRMKDSRDARIANVWPLIDAGMSRADCLAWADRNGLPRPPRSACVYCPYHSDREWVRLRDEEPQEFARAVEYERRLNEAVAGASALNADAAYLHASRVPLDRVAFDAESPQLNLFENECEGMCGL